MRSYFFQTRGGGEDEEDAGPVEVRVRDHGQGVGQQQAQVNQTVYKKTFFIFLLEGPYFEYLW